MNNIYIKDLVDFENILKDKKIDRRENNSLSPLIYCKDLDCFLLDERKIYFKKVPELSTSRFLKALELLEAINNRYIPIYNKNKDLLFTKEKFNLYRKKMGGIKEYNAGNFSLSDNLSFPGIESFLGKIDDNYQNVNEYRIKIIDEFIRIINKIGLKTTLGNNSGGDIELVEVGSTIRGTNLPNEDNDNLDFDFTVRVNPDKVWLIKNTLQSSFQAEKHITETTAYKVRLSGVKIPGMKNLVDLDFSLTPQKEKYLSTEEAVANQLNNIKEQDEEKYRLVLANIMYAKNYLKKSGVYKPSRAILNGGDRQLGGIGGIGIENWILQNGGSFIDATRDFLSHAMGKNFIDFQKEYEIMDFGKNHIEVSRGNFPHYNFIMKNMRHKGYEKMKEVLLNFITKYEKSNIINQSNRK